MTGTNQPLVRFKGVSKSYDGVSYVVKDLDLEVRDGEFLTLLGPSGSGKTTCLMMLAGFEFPTHGEIWLGDRLINRIPPHKREIGVVFQSYALFPHMTVAENVAYPLKVRRVPKARIAQEVRRVLDVVQMSAYADRLPARLSGGQQQRVALARALVFDPPLVLMDEPLGALDKRLREHMQLELKELHHRLGLTVVYVTHDQGEALTMSDRVAIFDAGRIQQIDTVNALYETPANGIVANFVGDNNQFHAVVQRCENGRCLLELADQTRVEGVADQAMPTGVAVQVCIRPERLAVIDADTPAENRMVAQAESLIYHGDHVRLRCRLVAGDQPCFVKLPLGDPLLEGFQGGQPVELGFASRHLRVFA